MPVEFQDNRVLVKETLNDKSIAFLHEASSELKTAAADKSRVAEGHLKGSWGYSVNESELESKIGSPLENAIWEEFGTGEHAVGGKGRGGYWVYVKDSSNDGGSKRAGKSYTLDEAKRIVAIMKSKGLDAVYTKGKKPNHTLQKAIDSKKAAIVNRAKQIFGSWD